MKKRHASSNEQFSLSEINTLFVTYNCDLEFTKILCKWDGTFVVLYVSNNDISNIVR